MDLRRAPLFLLILLAAAASGADSVDRALGEWDADALRAKQTYDNAVGRANDKAVKAYQSLAKAAARKGDNATATAAWRAVLEINRADPTARAFFTATGGLDDILAQLDQPTDLLGNPTAQTDPALPADAQAVTIGAAPGQEHVLGRLRAGQRFVVQYTSGVWNPRVGLGGLSPDDEAAPATYRLTLVDAAAPDVVVATIPPGTAAKPFAVTAPVAIARAILRLAPATNSRTHLGQVIYRIGVLQ